METPTHLTWAGRHAVELYVRTYTTMLQSSGEIRLDALQQAHMGMQSSLHPLAAEPRVDMGALIYAVRRLPAAIAQSRRVILGQSSGSIRAELGATRVGAPPVYVVSSNLHCLVNVLSGVARRLEGEISEFIREHDPELFSELSHIEAGEISASRDNWLYFAARVLFDSHPKKS